MYSLIDIESSGSVPREWELGVVVSDLGSQSKGCGFESCLFQILHGNGIIAMPGSIPIYYPILVH